MNTIRSQNFDSQNGRTQFVNKNGVSNENITLERLQPFRARYLYEG